MYATDDIVVRELGSEAIHLLLFTGDEVHLDTQAQLYVSGLLPRLLEGGEVYIIEVTVVLRNAHLADAPLLGNLAVGEDILNGHRTIAVSYNMQVVVDQRLLLTIQLL
jgi:hypothetical protein